MKHSKAAPLLMRALVVVLASLVSVASLAQPVARPLPAPCSMSRVRVVASFVWMVITVTPVRSMAVILTGDLIHPTVRYSRW